MKPFPCRRKSGSTGRRLLAVAVLVLVAHEATYSSAFPLLSATASAAATMRSCNPRSTISLLQSKSDDASSSSSSGTPVTSIDVSNLGLTMEDLNAPLPSEVLQGVATTGYESTSRIEDVQDNACQWTETVTSVGATLTIPGLRGQPSMALSVMTSTNTISIAAFGRIVWSCILRGQVLPETATFDAKDGLDMIPVIEYKVQKAVADGGNNERWGGFILQIGEDSIL
jgi:hypothetical protein